MIKEVKEKLKELQDEKYKKFNEKIIGNDCNIIGVRTPELKKIAKDIFIKNYEIYLEEVTNESFEETMIEGFVISNIKDYDISLMYLKKFVPKITNWALCDLFTSSYKIIKLNRENFLKVIVKYSKSKKEFERRFSIVSLIFYYIDDMYIEYAFDIIENMNINGYYVQMAAAWLISIAYIKEKDATKKYFKRCTLDDFTFNKAISKICDSKQIEKKEKDELKKIRR